MPHETDDAYPAANRAAKRDSLFLLTELFNENGASIASARVRNLSATGLMAECDRLLVEGDRVRLTLHGTGEIGATISWARDGRLGLVFDHSIDPKAARRAIAASSPSPSPGFTVTRFSRTLR